MRSLSDLGADKDEDSDEDDRNEYYAGGEKSGQARPRVLHACMLAPSESASCFRPLHRQCCSGMLCSIEGRLLCN